MLPHATQTLTLPTIPPVLIILTTQPASPAISQQTQTLSHRLQTTNHQVQILARQHAVRY